MVSFLNTKTGNPTFLFIYRTCDSLPLLESQSKKKQHLSLKTTIGVTPKGHDDTLLALPETFFLNWTDSTVFDVTKVHDLNTFRLNKNAHELVLLCCFGNQNASSKN